MFQVESFDPRSFSTYSWKIDGEPEPTKRSGVSRLWLIEYYTQEWAKNKAERKAESQPAIVEQLETIEATATPKRKKRKAVPKEVQALVDKAEADLDRLAQESTDVAASQQFIFSLLNFALDYPAPELIDFMSAAERYREKQRRDDEDLLLLAFAI